MTVARHGDTVRVHFAGKLPDGSVFISSDDREPLQLTLGEKRYLPGVENAILGMHPGETKTVEIVADDAYGSHNPKLVFVISRDNMPADFCPAVGEDLQLKSEKGDTVQARVTDVAEAAVTVDANHELAGKDLTFDFELVAILEEA